VHGEVVDQLLRLGRERVSAAREGELVHVDLVDIRHEPVPAHLAFHASRGELERESLQGQQVLHPLPGEVDPDLGDEHALEPGRRSEQDEPVFLAGLLEFRVLLEADEPLTHVVHAPNLRRLVVHPDHRAPVTGPALVGRGRRSGGRRRGGDGEVDLARVGVVHHVNSGVHLAGRPGETDGVRDPDLSSIWRPTVPFVRLVVAVLRPEAGDLLARPVLGADGGGVDVFLLFQAVGITSP